MTEKGFILLNRIKAATKEAIFFRGVATILLYVLTFRR